MDEWPNTPLAAICADQEHAEGNCGGVIGDCSNGVRSAHRVQRGKALDLAPRWGWRGRVRRW